MKPTILEAISSHAEAIGRGWVDPAGTGFGDVGTLTAEVENDTGGALTAGTVVIVKSNGKLGTTTTAQDTRPVGVVLDDIDAADFGPVAFFGPVTLINVIASVTAGHYAETSTTAGSAQANATPRSGSFAMFTSAGTSPAGFLWPFGSATFDDDAFLTELYDIFLTRATGERHVPETITAGATQTLDLDTANTFDVTLTANCTISFTSPPDSGVEGRWTIVLRQDATGSRTVTWPAAVGWRAANGTQTTTAPTLSTTANAVDTIDLRTLDGGATYGASLENGGSGIGERRILLADGHATPFTFNDLLQMDDGSDFMWSD